MVIPFGVWSWSTEGWSAVVGIGGGATGGSLFAASVSGRPINGEPGGNGACCCAAAGGVVTRIAPRVPASIRAHRRDNWVMIILPELIVCGALSLYFHRVSNEPPFDCGRSKSSACRPLPRRSAHRH